MIEENYTVYFSSMEYMSRSSMPCVSLHGVWGSYMRCVSPPWGVYKSLSSVNSLIYGPVVYVGYMVVSRGFLHTTRHAYTGSFLHSVHIQQYPSTLLISLVTNVYCIYCTLYITYISNRYYKFSCSNLQVLFFDVRFMQWQLQGLSVPWINLHWAIKYMLLHKRLKYGGH